MAVLLSLVAAAMILAGGTLALRARDRRHLVLGLAGGIVLGVVSFDLIPEALAAGAPAVLHVPLPMIAFAAGFAALHVAEQLTAAHRAHEGEYAPHRHPGASGRVAAGALITHTFLDGLTIGVALRAPGATGLLVCVAIFAHNFADGFTTVTFASLRRPAARRRAARFLAAAMLAPVAGAALATVIAVPGHVLRPYLGFVSGVLLYLAAADILPEAHAGHPRAATLAATGAGVAAVLLIVGTAHAH
ncbi:zinc transporter ZupT [Actinomadura rubteroloni]|uniref:Zinc transporter ZupT n=1 Tax=Actinomadura rubteroloni TaxID=1926885 RepID=A0A2P4UBT5_9ACTN|nr:ZIP family metal transporter [Actinomadura rubteroloni]POM22513.1 zinc transporter ZupT [Actinomadura rubteroloni]